MWTFDRVSWLAAIASLLEQTDSGAVPQRADQARVELINGHFDQQYIHRNRQGGQFALFRYSHLQYRAISAGVPAVRQHALTPLT